MKAYIGRKYIENYEGKMCKIDLSEKFYLDLSKKGHTFVIGKTGSGKSYFAGVLAEEIIEQHSQNMGVIIIDPLGVFGQLDCPNKNSKEFQSWKFGDIEPKSLEVHRLKPIESFSITITDFTPSNFCNTFDLDPLEPQSTLYRKAYNELKNSYFSIKDMITWLQVHAKEEGYKDSTAEALHSRLNAICELGLISHDGIKIEQIVKENAPTVIDLSSSDLYTAKIVVNFISEKILEMRKEITNKLWNLQNGKSDSIMTYIPPVHLIIDEAHNFFPNRFLKKIVKEGRNSGVILTAISQSVDLSRDIYSNISHLFVGKMLYMDEISKLREMIPFEKDLKVFRQEVRNLNEGQFIYFNINEMQEVKLKIRPRKTQHPASSLLVDEKSIIKISSENHPQQQTTSTIEPKQDIPVLRFTEDYRKLYDTGFSTIRLRPLSGLYYVTSPKVIGTAEVTLCHKKKLNELPEEFLKRDTDSATKEEALSKIFKIYPNANEDTDFFISRLVWKEKEVIA